MNATARKRDEHGDRASLVEILADAVRRFGEKEVLLALRDGCDLAADLVDVDATYLRAASRALSDAHAQLANAHHVRRKMMCGFGGLEGGMDALVDACADQDLGDDNGRHGR